MLVCMRGGNSLYYQYSAYCGQRSANAHSIGSVSYITALAHYVNKYGNARISADRLGRQSEMAFQSSLLNETWRSSVSATTSSDSVHNHTYRRCFTHSTMSSICWSVRCVGSIAQSLPCKRASASRSILLYPLGMSALRAYRSISG